MKRKKKISQLALAFILSALLLVIPNNEVVAEEPKSPFFCPDELSIGTIYQGSIIEANCELVYAETVYSIDHPSWITIRESIGNIGRDVPFYEIYLTMDTSQIGDFSDEITVETDKGVATLPVSVSVRNSPDPSVKLLITNTPFEMSSTCDGYTFNEMTRVISENYIDVDYLEQLPSDLSKYDVVFVAEGGLLDITSAEVNRLHDFIDSGGTVIVCADPFFIGTVDGANEIIIPYGLRMKNEDIYKEFILDKNNITPHELTKGIEKLRIFRPCLIHTIGNMGTIIVKNPENPNEGFVAVSEHNGAVIVFGNSLWWLNLAKSVEYDNNILFGNMMTYVTPPPSFLERLNSPLYLKTFMVLILFIFVGYPIMKKALNKGHVKTEHKFLLLIISFTILLDIVDYPENPILQGLSISLIFFSILFFLILVEYKKVIPYLLLSAFAVSMCLAILEEGQFRHTISVIAYVGLASLAIYTICLFASLFPLKYSNKGQNKSKLVASIFLSWITVYAFMVFLGYIISSYDTLLEGVTIFTPLLVPAIVSPLVIYFIHGKIVKIKPAKKPFKKEIKEESIKKEPIEKKPEEKPIEEEKEKLQSKKKISPRIEYLLKRKEELNRELEELKKHKYKLISQKIVTEEEYKKRYEEIIDQLVDIEDKIIQEK